ncbi:cutinase family protein [Rhodococcus oryzae]|uniref:Cutinase family protein n=1 Tax=Rhodococcus oryzae TaxID=2571143 RepID=A0ABY2RNF9_9NOCA|nr:cutinase family protein [Rhodococcus oryzae]TJZ80010.1 cutinase family protein [Rhodococcus oryzae]
MRLKKSIAVLSAFAAATVGTVLSGTAAQADPAGGNCPSMYVVAVPGTWETSTQPDKRPGPGMLAAVTNALPASKIRSDYVTYAATAFPWEGEVYGASKKQATDNARGMLEAMQKACANTRFGIIGYSQGADAAGDLAAEIGTGTSTIRPEKVAAVGLLSDPRRADSDVLIGPAVPGIGSGGPRIGGFGWLSDRTVTFCAPGDLYCATERTDFVTRLAGFLAQNSDPGSSDSPRYGDEATMIWNDLLGAGGIPTLQNQLTDEANKGRRKQLERFYGSGAHQDYQGYAVDKAGNTPTTWLAGWLRDRA